MKRNNNVTQSRPFSLFCFAFFLHFTKKNATFNSLTVMETAKIQSSSGAKAQKDQKETRCERKRARKSCSKRFLHIIKWSSSLLKFSICTKRCNRSKHNTASQYEKCTSQCRNAEKLKIALQLASSFAREYIK